MDQETPASCPSAVDLESFVVEGGVNETVKVHLEKCPDCRAHVESIRDNNELFLKLAGIGGRDAPVATVPGSALKIPGYDIHEEKHRGGQGVVFRATQLATNRQVAVKLLTGGAFATSRQRRRFEREIDLVASLRHPNIVTVHDSGVTADGQLYLVMEYVDGLALDSYVDRVRESTGGAAPTQRDMLTLFQRICGGLSCAHQRGVIHRDLKPANIIIDATDEPRVLDFGLARPIDPVIDAEDAAMTRSGEFVGTLSYASPEQTRGDTSLVDTRSDIYSLGVILYELLTDHLPYPVTGSLTEVLHSITDVEPAPPNSWAGDSTGAEGAGAASVHVDRDLETILLKTLAKSPERRYQTVNELQQDIDHHLTGQPIAARRDSTWYVFRKTATRYKVHSSIAAVFFILLTTFAISMWVLYGRAQTEYRRAQTEAAKANEIRVFLEDTLGSVDPAQPGGDVTIRELLDEAVQWVEIALSGQLEIQASLRMTIGNSYRSLGELQDAETQLQVALSVRRALFGESHEEVAQSLNSLGLLRRDAGELAEAEQLIRDALTMRRGLHGDDHLIVAQNAANLAIVLRDAGKYPEADRLFNEGLRIRRKILGESHPGVAMCLFNLATVRQAVGDVERAEELHAQALAIRRRELHVGHPDIPRSLTAVGSIRLASKRFNEALPLLDECVRLQVQVRPKMHWRIAEARGLLGQCLTGTGDYERAETELLQAHANLAEAFSPDDPHAQRVVTALVDLYDAWDRPEEAVAWRDRLVQHSGDDS